MFRGAAYSEVTPRTPATRIWFGSCAAPGSSAPAPAPPHLRMRLWHADRQACYVPCGAVSWHAGLQRPALPADGMPPHFPTVCQWHAPPAAAAYIALSWRCQTAAPGPAGAGAKRGAAKLGPLTRPTYFGDGSV